MVERIAVNEAIGTVSWRQVRYGPTPESLAWNIGISLIPEMRGLGFGTLAQRLLADHLAATSVPAGSTPQQTSRTSPSNVHWRRQASSARGC